MFSLSAVFFKTNHFDQGQAPVSVVARIFDVNH